MRTSVTRRTLRLGALGLTLALAGVTSPALALSSSTIVGVAAGRCLDVSGRNTSPGGRIIIWDCNGQDNQAWTLTGAGELRVYGAALCLEVVGHDTTAPAQLQTSTCQGGAHQRWTLDGQGAIRSVESNLCLDVNGAQTARGTSVILWNCHGQTNQRWKTSLTPADTTPPTVPGSPRVSTLTCNSVTLGWNAATDNVAVSFYDIFHDGQLMKSVSGGTFSTSLTVVPGATWGLYVNARDAAGNVSQASASVFITPPPCETDTTPPTAPTRLSGSAAGTSVTLSWTASSDNTGVRAYEVFRGSGKVGTVSGAGATPPATTFTDSGVPAASTVSYYVIAKDGQGNASPQSNAVSVTTGASCGSPVCGVTQVATDTDLPWGLLTLPDGSVLYGRRDARDLIRLDPFTGAKTTVGTVPNVSGTDGEGGLLGLAIAPSFGTDPWLYIMHTTATDNRIVRIKLAGLRLDVATEQILLSGIGRNKYHNGGRLRFGPDGKLYASTGDAQNGDYAQDRANLNGKVLRINADGTVPADNPFGNAVWSYGHRNPQGLAFDSQGRLWEQEFGNSVMDETNLITKGGNYGWPACEGTTGTCGTPGYIAPKRTYPTAEGSCSGIAIVRDVLYVACQRGTRMYREVISGTDLTNVQTFFNGTYGRLRTVEPAPSGDLWVTTTNGGDKDSIANNSNEKIFRVDLGA